jgi:hypothetical protein
MSDFLEDELRRALRPADPGDDFTRSVMARITRAAAAAPIARRIPVSHRVAQWLPAALAASLLAAIIVNHEHVEERTVQEGLRAREQLLQALRVTSEKLDLAYDVVHDTSSEPQSDDAGV